MGWPSRPCPEGCTCGKHTLVNAGQFSSSRGGRAMGGGAKKGWKGTTDERFDSYVLVSDGPDGCHLWTGGSNRTGYGFFKVDGRTVHAHAFADDRVNGPLPAGLARDHLCMVRRCVNPAHIERVTPAENNRRAAEARKRRKAAMANG